MTTTTHAPPAAFSIEEVARRPPPGTAIPLEYQFGPKDDIVTYLYSEQGGLVRQLYAYDVGTGSRRQIVDPQGAGVREDNLSLEEKLRRERKREVGLGVTRYAWSKQGSKLLIPLGGGISVQEGVDGELRQIVAPGQHPALDPSFSRDGSQVAFVRDAEVYVVPSAGGRPRQLTRGARGDGKTHGLAEYIAQEEMGRYRGFWWSWDGRHIAYTEVDERHIPMYRIVHQGKDGTGPDAREDHRYPFAGASNAVVRLGVVPARGGRTVWMDLDMDGAARDPITGGPDIYLARVHWMPDGRLLAELESRDQSRLELVEFDLRSGRRRVLLSESSEVWINLHRLFRPIERGPYAGGFLWGSERSGFMHLYLYDQRGQLVHALTEGEWLVTDLAGVDEVGGQVYVNATKDDPRERHLYAVPLAGGEMRRITQEPGEHEVVLDHGFTRFVDLHSSISTPPTVTVRNLSDGAVVASLYDQVDPRIEALEIASPEMVRVESRDGVTLYGALYRPTETPGQGPPAIIVSVYGGPHAQRVTNSWKVTVDMRAQYLRSLGYAVFKLDNRGSANRGLAFEGALKHDMGNIEVQDQVDGVRWLAREGLGDANRVGIYGWSYGGYMAAMALARAPETFHVAVAGAPVSSWDGYDTHYTERYMGTPASNPTGYRDSAVTHHVAGMKGRLLLVHGLIDENVHFRHTARLINALIEHRKDYDLLLFPDERHLPRGLADRVYMEEQVRDFFRNHL
ncbi:DPP IV N-terminal domain-containing protein [Haliangium sp.]|uniref:S9 family peptidase n=1 Tax=Haliangium sp. TaxID=2663208 RepID=UPI003D0BDF39